MTTRKFPPRLKRGMELSKVVISLMPSLVRLLVLV